MVARAYRRLEGGDHGSGASEGILDPYAERFLRMVAVGRSSGAGIAERREGLRDLARLGGPGPAHVAARDLKLPGGNGALAARLYDGDPARADRFAPGLLYVHGGGLVAGDLDTHDAACRELSAASGCRIVSIDYRLAPEHPFPAGLEDVKSAYRAALGSAETLGIDPARFGIGGDSAGAGLVALACLDLADDGLAIPVQLLICPVLAVGGDTNSRRDFAKGYFLDAASVRRDAIDCGLTRAHDPFVALARRDLSAMPPALIHTAGFDMMRDEGFDHALRLERAGVPVAHTCHRTMIHYFYALGRLIPRSREILAAIGAELADALETRPATSLKEGAPS